MDKNKILQNPFNTALAILSIVADNTADGELPTPDAIDMVEGVLEAAEIYPYGSGGLVLMATGLLLYTSMPTFVERNRDKDTIKLTPKAKRLAAAYTSKEGIQAEIDSCLWLLSQQKLSDDKPYHRTLTTFY